MKLHSHIEWMNDVWFTLKCHVLLFAALELGKKIPWCFGLHLWYFEILLMKIHRYVEWMNRICFSKKCYSGLPVFWIISPLIIRNMVLGHISGTCRISWLKLHSYIALMNVKQRYINLKWSLHLFALDLDPNSSRINDPHSCNQFCWN